MPSETFFRLPESKQERIIEALKTEIANVPYEDFSIGSIIRKCGISRGSFYQYFHSKEEIYLYFLSGYQKQIIDYATHTLQENNGDFFAGVESTYRYAARMLCYKDSKAFRHNLFCNMRIYELLWQKSGFAEESQHDISCFKESVNFDLLALNNREEFDALFDIAMTSALKDLVGIFMKDASEHTVLERFLLKLRLLKRAFQK